MSYLGPSEARRLAQTEDQRWVKDIERAAAQRDVLSGAKRSDYAPHRARLFDRIRRMFSRGAALAGSEEPEVSEEQVWERERQRRREYEQDRLSRGD